MSEKANVKLSTRSWHYKLIKFILGSIAPTPGNMHNLCPYFWLMIFSIIVFPIVAPIRGLWLLLSAMMNVMDKFMYESYILPNANRWEDKLSEMDVFLIGIWKLPVSKNYHKVYYRNDQMYVGTFVRNWWKAKYDPDEKLSIEDFSKRFEEWSIKMRAEYNEILGSKMVLREELSREKRQRNKKYQDFRKKVDSFFQRIVDSLHSWKSLILWTKRFVGLVITAIGLITTYFIVNYAGRGVLWVLDNWDWTAFIGLCSGVAVVFIIIGIIKGLAILIEYLKERGRQNTFINILYYPSYVLYLLLKRVFYDFIWGFILVRGWKLLKNSGILLWGGIMGFLGIFGEYFGASYTDYCPGIEWEEESE